MKSLTRSLRVCLPCIVQSFDAQKQTVTVQVAITERVLDKNNIPQPTKIPVLTDLPICLPRAGGFALTMPIQAGDEGLAVFGDTCIDGWYQLGGVQNQVEIRRHDLSDGFFIPGVWSQPNVIADYSTEAAQLRSIDGNTVIEVGSGEVTIKATNVTVQAEQVNVTGSESVTISGNNQTTVDGVNFKEHTHSGVTAGGGVTGPVVG